MSDRLADHVTGDYTATARRNNCPVITVQADYFGARVPVTVYKLVTAGQFVSGLAERGRCNVNFPPHTGQPPSQTSYSYNGICKIRNPNFEIRSKFEVGSSKLEGRGDFEVRSVGYF